MPLTQGRRGKGFTLIELMVVMSIIATLLTIAVPRYFNHVDRAKEASLKQSLSVMRDAIDKFHGDVGRYPESLDELVGKRYLRQVPVDPLTSKSDWLAVAPPEGNGQGALYDLHSRAAGNGADNLPYSEW